MSPSGWIRYLLLLGVIVCMGIGTATAAGQGKGPTLTPARIEQDLIGQSVPYLGMQKVTLKSGRNTSSDTETSTTTKQSLELSSDSLGYTFTEDDIQTVRIIETKRQGSQASIVVYLDTISSYAGKVRLHYELITGEWYLKQIENLSFKPY